MAQLPAFSKVCDLRMGEDPAQEAWILHFLMENNIEYLLNPGIVASPEQLSFIVALKENQVYIPADDQLFKGIYSQTNAPELLEEYTQVWRFVHKVVQDSSLEEAVKERVLSLCRYRFEAYLDSRILLPSRMIKRLVGIVLAQTSNPDPFKERKAMANKNAVEVLANEELREVLLHCPDFSDRCLNIEEMRKELDFVELKHLFRLSTFEPLWKNIGAETIDKLVAELEKDCSFCASMRDCLSSGGSAKKIMFIPDVAGGFVLDLAIIRVLLRQGHKVVLPLKQAFYFNTPNLWDLEDDPILQEGLGNAFFISEDDISKNELLRYLRENQLVIINDGTAESLNFYRTSVTFARAWKECDLIIAKGLRNSKILLGTSHEFTRDILCFWRSAEGEFHVQKRAKASWVRQFTEKDLALRAETIIREIKEARREGKSIMFYSAVIGSVPGQTKVAIELVNTFVNHLRGRLENTFIINPAEHFEEGMDGDDLMFMWEKVQRSGLLDVWRFQTVEDIESSFAILERKVPSIWSGKDSTFSTGCTKEMRIALDMQKANAELQIIGPSPEKFFRRVEYGVGKYFDRSIKV